MVPASRSTSPITSTFLHHRTMVARFTAASKENDSYSTVAVSTKWKPEDLIVQWSMWDQIRCCSAKARPEIPSKSNLELISNCNQIPSIARKGSVCMNVPSGVPNHRHQQLLWIEDLFEGTGHCLKCAVRCEGMWQLCFSSYLLNSIIWRCCITRKQYMMMVCYR